MAPPGRPPLAPGMAAPRPSGAANAKPVSLGASGERQAALTGWLLKRKKGRIFGGTNRRFFTVDFAAQIFYYANKEAVKQVSRPLSFRDIVGVESLTANGELPGDAPIVPCCEDGEMMEAADDTTDSESEAPARPAKKKASDAAETGSQMSKGTTSSFSSRFRLPSFAKRKEKSDVFGFALYMRGVAQSERCMELLCETKEEKNRWLTAFNSAMMLVVAKPVTTPMPVAPGGGGGGGGYGGVEAANKPSSEEQSTDGDDLPVAGGYPADGDSAAAGGESAGEIPAGMKVDAHGFPESDSDEDSD